MKKFNKWFEEKLFEVKDFETLRELDFSSIEIDLTDLENLYNLYKNTGLLDIPEVTVAYCKKEDKYCIVIDCTILEYDFLFSTIKTINCSKLYNNFTREDFYNHIFVSGDVLRKVNGDDEFYFLASINPNEFNIGYIEEVEKILNKGLTNHTTVDDLYDEFMDECKHNYLIKPIMITLASNLAFIAFETAEEYDRYLANRDLETSPIVCNKEQLLDLLKEIAGEEKEPDYFEDLHESEAMLS